MTLPTHILLGAIIGKLSGNYSLAIIFSVMPDVDHLGSYIKNGVFKSRKVFWQTISSKDDPYGDQRGYLHNILVPLFVFMVLCVKFPTIATIVALGWFGHLFLDALDNADYWPLYPYKKINIRGYIKYYSVYEFVLLMLLTALYLIV